MKALTLAAVIALSATGAAALDSYEIFTKGVKITEFNNTIFNQPTKDMMYLYNGLAYYCYVQMGKAPLPIRVGCNVQSPIGLTN